MKDNSISYEDYVDIVKREFKKCIRLSDKLINEYFEEKDTIDYLKLAYSYYVSGDLYNAYNPIAVANCLDIMY